ncbi:hypothetical protein HHX47_DHR2000146 [Lentinula edodes]|nr:hypothetical protein HHX47_DHR2000146 [Lentinula edodes]
MSDPSRLSTTPDIDDEEDRHNQVAVWNTLLEFYLTLPGISSSLGSSVPQDEVVLKEKALRVFRSETMLYDTTHALFLMLEPRIYQGFSPSLRDMGMSEDVLRIWMERNKERATCLPDNETRCPDCARTYAVYERYGGIMNIWRIIMIFFFSKYRKEGSKLSRMLSVEDCSTNLD